jgi:ankyrin repeat protein
MRVRRPPDTADRGYRWKETAVNLEQLRKRAKERLREERRADPEIKLSDVQLAIAREHGFASWPRMKAYVDRLAEHPDGLQFAYHTDLGYYEDRAYGLRASADDGTAPALAAFEHGDAPLTQGGARLVLARAHGFPSWQALRRHVGRLPGSGEPFFRAYRAIEAHDPDGLGEVLDRWPEVAALEGTNGNDLLAMATSTRDERTVQLLLDRGADPSHANAHGWTALHQAAYVNAVDLAQRLLRAGGRAHLSARGDGGTPLIVALFCGYRKVTEVLAPAGMHPRNLRTAAGLGDLSLVNELAGSRQAGAHRGFYRPHSGFPAWTPSEDPQEILDEALAYGARNGRVRVLAALVDHGARLEADVYRGTPLIWAASRGRSAAVTRLLSLGADPIGRGSFGGESHGKQVTPLHLAGASGDARTVKILLDAGADPSVVDGHGYGTPASWARHGGHDDVAALIERRA